MTPSRSSCTSRSVGRRRGPRAEAQTWVRGGGAARRAPQGSLGRGLSSGIQMHRATERASQLVLHPARCEGLEMVPGTAAGSLGLGVGCLRQAG